MFAVLAKICERCVVCRMGENKEELPPFVPMKSDIALIGRVIFHLVSNNLLSTSIYKSEYSSILRNHSPLNALKSSFIVLAKRVRRA